jgi:hypothetical protein
MEPGSTARRKQVSSAMDKRTGSRASDSDTTIGGTHTMGYKLTLIAVGTMLWDDLLPVVF